MRDALSAMLALLLVLVFMLTAAVIREISAQERDHAYHQTRSWMLDHEIRVIDTAGVCLYVYAGFRTGTAMVAVPKTQLPSGTGCQ